MLLGLLRGVGVVEVSLVSTGNVPSICRHIDDVSVGNEKVRCAGNVCIGIWIDGRRARSKPIYAP